MSDVLAKIEPEIMPSYPSAGEELVIAFVAAVGVNLTIAEHAVKKCLKKFNYSTEDIKVTQHVLPRLNKDASNVFTGNYERIGKMMDIGTEARGSYGTDILAKGIAAEISRRREEKKTSSRTAFLIHSLKHPDEALRLRHIYSRGFYLIGVHAHPKMRLQHLMEVRQLRETEALELMDRDKKENVKHGQQVNDTFHLADFFVGWAGDDKTKFIQGTLGEWAGNDENTANPNTKRVEASIDRFIDIIFAHPHKTPTFGEYAMFTAFTSSLRSADLSRQVGAVVARSGEILSTGANDCPAPGGGLYWPQYNSKSGEISDLPNGRDYMRGYDSNRREQDNLIDKILNATELADWEKDDIDNLRELLGNSPIRNLIEYGRVVHAEMEALLACARTGVSTKGATIYCTTFPCHNCAKHIIAAGIKRVVFVEPYLKSKAFIFHDDAIMISYPQDEASANNESLSDDFRVKFEPFFGVGPRRFFDLFSMSLGSGFPVSRKRQSGEIVNWDPITAIPRLAMQRSSFIDAETLASVNFDKIRTTSES